MGSKVLNMDELAEIVKKSVDYIDDADQMKRFTYGIAEVITEHFGGRIYVVSNAEDPLVHIEADECIPKDGGIYRDYDKDIPAEEFMEDTE